MSGSVTPTPTPAVTAVAIAKTPDDLTGWRSKTMTLMSRTAFLVNTPEMSDVKFIFKTTNEGTEDTIIYGHKFILAMASPVFYKMFFIQNPELLTPVGDEVEMKDHPFTAEAFITFVKFLYTDKINYEAYQGLAMELIFGVLNCADYYDVPYLKTDCVKEVLKLMTRTNVIQIFEAAAALLFREYEYGYYSLNNKAHAYAYGLARSALVFMDENLQFVIESDEILNVKKKTLFAFLNRNSLDLDECFVLDLALKWAEQECKRKSLELTAENKRKVLGAVFLEIRFALLTSDRISELVASNFLTLKESLDISLSVHNPGHLTRISTRPDGSKFRRNAPEITFKSKPRVFGQKMELMESRKMEEKWKEENKLDFWKSLAKVQADLFMGGFSWHKDEFQLKADIELAGFDTVLSVIKQEGGVMRRNSGRFRVKFLYNPSIRVFETLLNPSTYGFFDSESIEIRQWGSLGMGQL